MAENELYLVRLKTEFYRDGFTTILISIVFILVAIASLVAFSLYLFLSKPKPVYFSTDQEWRILAPVPLNKPYLQESDLLQWVSQALPIAFTYDFLHSSEEQKNVAVYFTPKGWQNLLGQLNNYHIDEDALQADKIFVNTQLTAAPFILNQGLLPEGKYAWRVQIPMNIHYSNGRNTPIVVIAFIVRISTLNNLYGVAIDDMNISAAEGNQVKTNG